MTEDEAKTKWCPFVRAFNNGPYGPFNRWVGEAAADHKTMRCIGSDCMAWRLDQQATQEALQMAAHNDGPYPVPVQGYCGLAGKPND